MARRCLNYHYLHIFGCPSIIVYKCHYYEVHALGLSNLCDLGNRKYWTWFIDFDREPDWNNLPKNWWLIVKSKRGYHIYLDIWEKKHIAAFKSARRWYKHGADKGHLWIAKMRLRHGLDFSAVIRIKGKYLEGEIELIDYKRPKKIPDFYVDRVLSLL